MYSNIHHSKVLSQSDFPSASMTTHLPHLEWWATHDGQMTGACKRGQDSLLSSDEVAMMHRFWSEDAVGMRMTTQQWWGTARHVQDFLQNFLNICQQPNCAHRKKSAEINCCSVSKFVGQFSVQQTGAKCAHFHRIKKSMEFNQKIFLLPMDLHPLTKMACTAEHAKFFQNF